MGLGRWDAKRKRHMPITPWEGSWAHKMQRRREERDAATAKDKEMKHG